VAANATKLRFAHPLAALLPALASLQALPSAAAEWSASGQVYQQLGYNDNIRLSTDDESSSAVSITAGSLNLRGETPILQLGLDGEADIYHYFEEDDLNTNNQYLRGFVTRQHPRGEYGIEGSFRRDSDIVSFLDSGGDRTLDDERRHTFNIAPSFTYLLSPLSQVQGTAGYTRRTYPDSDTRIDYSLWNGNAGWNRLVTRRTSLGANLYTSYFDSSRQEATFLSPQGFVGYKYAERLDLQFSAGPSIIWTDTQRSTATGLEDESDTSLGYAVDSRAIYDATETTELQVAFSRLLEPSGDSGEATESTRLRGTMIQRLTPYLRFQLDGVAQRKTAVGDDTGFDDRDDLELQPRLRWSLTEEVELSINYRLRYRQFDEGDDATSNAFFVRLSYDFPEYRTSW
jgi:hypothetical protein